MSPSEQNRPSSGSPSSTARTATAQQQPGTAQQPAAGPATARQPRVERPERQPDERPAGERPAGQRPAGQRTSTAQRPVGGGQFGPRRVRLTVSRVDPWSVMKLAFLLSVAIGIALVVAAGVLWSVLDGMGVFADVNSVVGQILDDASFDVNDYVGFSKVISLATVVAVVDVVLITAIATLGAFLYNLASTLVGGLHVTLTDD